MFGIGDFARHGRISVRMLRHYDAIGLLRPAHVDQASGYRWYRADQLDRLNRILALKDLGFTLGQVQAILDDQVTVDELRGMLRLRRADLQTHIADDLARLARAGLGPGTPDGERPTQGGPGPAVAWYEDAPDGDGAVVVHAALPVPAGVEAGAGPDVAIVDLPRVEQAASIVHRGAMDHVLPTVQTLARWIEANGYRSAGYARELYIQSPPGALDRWVTELQEPVTPAGP